MGKETMTMTTTPNSTPNSTPLDLARTVREWTAASALEQAAVARSRVLDGPIRGYGAESDAAFLGEWSRHLTLALKVADVELRRITRLWDCADGAIPYAVGGPHVAAVHRERYEEPAGSRPAVLRGYRRQLRVLAEVDAAALPAAPSLLADHIVEIESRHGEPICLDLFYVRWSLASLGIWPSERRTVIVQAGRQDQPVVLSLAERGSYAVIMRAHGEAAGRASTRVEVRPVEVAS
jgi:hypothetical protein